MKEKEEEKQLHIWYDKIDYMIISNEYLADKFQSAFHLTEEQILKTGMPRSDIFFQKNNLYEEIRKKYKLDKKMKIVLYAPTYRYDAYELLEEKDIEYILNALQERFGGEWVFFFRAHSFDNEKHYQFPTERLYDCSDYYDTQEFLCATDVLITDYSSMLWDFSLLSRPCFCFAKEPKQYARDERDFYIPYEKWPYPKGSCINELIDKISNFNFKEYQIQVKNFVTRIGNMDDGMASERVINLLENFKEL